MTKPRTHRAASQRHSYPRPQTGTAGPRAAAVSAPPAAQSGAASWKHAAAVAIIVLFAALMLLVCSKSSPLYPMNDWVDVHCFFTLGRGIKHGLVPYLDLYEQKGPLIYFLYALASLISEHTFLGVYLLEVACFAVFLHYSGKTAACVSGASWAYPLTAAAMGFTIPWTPAFCHGGSAEQLLLAALAVGLYIVIRAMNDGRRISVAGGLTLGVMTAAAFWTKYTFCGFFAGLAIGVILYYAVRRWFGELFRLIGWFVLGFLLPSALIVGWFAARGGLTALWNAYFVNNLNMYSSNIGGGTYDPPLIGVLRNLPWSIPAVLGLVIAFFRKGHRIEAVTNCLAAVILFAFTYMSGRRYPYYALIMCVFAVMGYGGAFYWIRRWTARRPRLVRQIAAALTALIILGGPFSSYYLSPNTYLLGTERKRMPPYRFAEKIRETEDQTLLNQGFLDGGFYFAAGVLPSSPYFCTLNISLPEMREALQRSIQEGRTAYVVTRQRELNPDTPYELIDQASFPFEGATWTYYLYRRKGLQ